MIIKKKQKILVIGELDLPVICAPLKEKGFKVVTSSTKAQALETAETFTPNLIILNSGELRSEDYVFLIQARSFQKWQQVPCIFIMPSISEEDQLTLEAIGGDYYLCRPFTSEQLVDLVKDGLKRGRSPSSIRGLLTTKAVLSVQVQRLRDDWRILTSSLERVLPSAVEKKRLLIVEDHDLLLLAIRDILEVGMWEEGCEICTAENGIDALEVMKNFTPDLIISDISMPGMDGYQFLEKVRACPKWKLIPFIFLTARAENVDKLKGLSLGGAEYITKPFDPQELCLCVKSKLIRVQEIQQIKHNDFLVSEVKRLEKKLAYAQFQFAMHRERLDSSPNRSFPLAEVSRLTDGIVHDMRSSLGIISHTLGFLEENLNTSENQGDLQRIHNSLELCELILRNLTALGGQDIFEPTWLDLQEIANAMYFLLERKLNNVNLVIDAEPEIPKVLADRGQMKQVFMNLIKNAGEAMPNGGTLTFRTRREVDMLCIELSDTGCGISRENRKKLFKEFFTTKERGYGLGLQIVHTIIQRHSGTIKVKSKVGKGTTFIIHLPLDAGATDD